MKPRTPLKRQSPQRSRDNAKYRHLVVGFLVEHMFCFRCGNFIPPRHRTCHHKYGRVHALLCWVPGWIMLCRACHRHVETHRNDAVRDGYRAPDNLFNRPSLVIPR